MEPFAEQDLSGWGRYPVHRGAVYRPEKRRAVAEILSADTHDHLIARGLGRSYGDPSTNDANAIISFVRLDRMISFDAETATLECEAGVSLEGIIEAFLPRGFFLPVTPGTKFVTVGGAIANDVHGKNHHRVGSFGNAVERFTLLTGAGEVLTCSRNENEDVFWATLGGAGLTGMILTACVRLQCVESAYIKVDYVKCPSLDDLLAAIVSGDEGYQYSVAWVDCLASGAHLGRSVLMRGNHASRREVSGDPYQVPVKKSKRIPIDFPSIALNPLTIRGFNEYLYHLKFKTASGVIEDYDTYFYPLDAIQQWNRMYGKRGFVQYQVTFPIEEVAALQTLLERMSAARRASFLAVLKRFGPGNEGLLSYPMEGYTLTLDLPVNDSLIQFLHKQDALLLDHGGKLYLGKDAIATAETIAAMYPKLDDFRAICDRLDPERRISSSQSRRLNLRGEGIAS